MPPSSTRTPDPRRRHVRSLVSLAAVGVLGAGLAMAAAPASASVAPDADTTLTAARVRTNALPSDPSWPSADNTGVPDGTTLTPYLGPCTITSPVTIDKVNALSCDALLIRAKGVQITNSRVPRVDVTDPRYSVTITDTNINASDWVDGALWGYNFTATRVEIKGGQHSVHCNDYCTVIDSWLHGQYNPDSESFHTNAFISNGGSHMLVRHNTLNCTSFLNENDGGCTADLSLFGDFDPITDVWVDNNLFRANNNSISYCAYGGWSPAKRYPIPTQVRFTNNVFEHGANGVCGVFGPVTSFLPSATNVWSGNVYGNGEPITVDLP